MKRIVSLILVLLITLPLSSCFHDNWDIPEREDPDFDLGALLGVIAPPLGGVETMPNGIVLTLSDDESFYIVSDASKCEAEKVTIPKSYQGIPIKEIARGAFSKNDSIVKISIPSSVINIGSNAFFESSKLEFNVYEGAKYLGNEENPYHALIEFTDTAISSPVIHEETRVISAGACKNINAQNFKKIVIPDSVVSVCDAAFEMCSNVHTLVIGNGVETIGNNAFSKMIRLTNLIVGNSVKTIGEMAFYSEQSLETLALPDSVTEIGESAFSGCAALVKVHIGEGVRIIGDYAFSSCIGLDTVYMGNSVEVIGKNAFSLCTELESISLPHSVESISPYAFYGCSKLDYNEYGGGLYLGNPENPYEYLVGIGNTTAPTLSIHSDTRRIAQMLFYVHGFSSFETLDGGVYLTVKNNCIIDHTEKKLIAGLASSTIPTDVSVTSIGDYAFYGIEGFKSTTIPSNITSIGEHAFEKCTGIYSLTIKGDVTIGAYAFSECISMNTVKFTKEAKYIGDYAFSRCTSLKNISIPDTVEYLGRSAFESCFALTEAYIGSRVSEIPDNAFRDCKNLGAVKLGDAPKSIGDGAFMECYSLSYFDFNEGIEYIGDRAFYLCEALPYVTLPESLLGIGEMAFAGCGKLRWLNLGVHLQELGNLAFHGIPMNIDVKYRGTVQMWQKIKNAHNVYKGEQKLKVICSDGEILLEPDDVIITVYAPD